MSYTIIHVPGEKICIADALSRSPVNTISCKDQQEVNAYVNLFIHNLPGTEIQSQQDEDPGTIEKGIQTYPLLKDY